MDKNESLKILLVEDNPADQKLTVMALAKQPIKSDVDIANTAEDAAEYLQKAAENNGNLPDLIILDLNMPGMGGKELLRFIKNHEDLKSIPVVVMTTSDSDKDIGDCYALHADGYVEKPATLREFEKVIGGIEYYWFILCKRVSERKARCLKKL